MHKLNTKEIDWPIVVPTLLLVSAIVVTLVLFPDLSKILIYKIFGFITDKFGWLYLLCCLVSFSFLAWVTFSRYGNIKLGGKDEKPAHSNFAWAGMLFTSGVGSSAIILGFIEPLYYLKAPPFQLEPFSADAYEFAHMYGQFHWGPSAWAFYIPAIVAVSLVVFKGNQPALRLSAVNAANKQTPLRKAVNTTIDTLVMFGIIASISTSLGLAVPVMSKLFSGFFGIENGMPLKIGVLLIWVAIFMFSVYRGLDKGIKILSNINVVLLGVFLLAIFLVGPSTDIIKMEITSVGLYFENFIRMNTWMDPFGSGEFLKLWTLFYWGWWLSFMPLMALFIVRISRGRTLKSVIWQQLLWGSLGCWACFAVCGGYSLALQKSGAADLVHTLETQGQDAVIVQLLQSMPFSPFIIVLFCVLLFVFLATTIDSAAFILASSSIKTGSEKEPSRKIRIFWACVLAVLSIGLLVIDELKAVQIISLIAGLPMIFVQFYMCYKGKQLVEKYGSK